ncbi:MAG TPA: hypothetical protein DDW30_08285 [Clostridiales bacterium]|nr:hypothetical protein [Clostridiales bacterium]
MKRRIGFLLTVCMVLTLMLGLFVPTTADDAAVGGEIIPSGNGVVYSFGGIQAVDKNEIKQKYEAASKSGNYNDQFSYFRNEDGIVFAVYGDSSWAEVSGEETLIVKNINNHVGIGLSFVSNFAYPNPSGLGFWGINAIAIRYRVLNQNADETINFVGVGQWTDSAKGTCEIRASEEWVETIYELTPTAGASQTFGYWFGEYMDVINTNSLSFNGVSKGATIELDYIGLFTTVDEAQVEMNRRNSIRIAENETFVSKNQAGGDDGQVIRFTGIHLADGSQTWATDCGINQFAPKDGRDFYNDADGNLVMVTKTTEGLWSPICISHTNLQYVCAQIVELRYKTTDLNGSPVDPPAFTKDVVKIGYKNDGDINVTIKEIVTTKDKDGWSVTRIYVDTTAHPSGMWPIQDGGITSIDFPSADTSMKYVIDYVGFFNNEAVADANTKRARVFDGDAVRLNGVQVKKNSGNGIRFVGVIDDYTSEAYEEFGFKICLGDKVTDSIVTGKIQHYVYRQIKAGDALVDLPTDYVTGQDENSAYFTYCINDIPASAFTDGKITFKVCAYAKIKGAEICGPTYTVVYDCNTQTATYH